MTGKASAGTAEEAIMKLNRGAAPPFVPDMGVFDHRIIRQGLMKWKATDQSPTYDRETVGKVLDENSMVPRLVNDLMGGLDERHAILGPYFLHPRIGFENASPIRILCESVMKIRRAKVVDQEFNIALMEAGHKMDRLGDTILRARDYPAFHHLLVCLYDSMEAIFVAFRLHKEPKLEVLLRLPDDVQDGFEEVALVAKKMAKKMSRAFDLGYVCEDFYSRPRPDHEQAVFAQAMYICDEPQFSGLVKVFAHLRLANHRLFLENDVPPMFSVERKSDESDGNKLREFVHAVVRMFRAENSRALAISKHERRLIFRWLTHCALGLTEDDVYYVMRVFRQSADGMLNLFRVEVADPKRVYQSPASDSASASAGVKTCPMCERSSLCWYRDCVESRTRNIEVDPLRDDGCGIFRLVSSF
jgi:hypothetical protein